MVGNQNDMARDVPSSLPRLHEIHVPTLIPVGDADIPDVHAHAGAIATGGVCPGAVGVDPDPANAQKITSWCKGYWDALHPFSAGGAHVNFMMEEGQDRVQATYRDNYRRLAKIKKKYDPKNFFRVNQNIQPAG
jgi:hypothetical protein